MNSFLQTLTTGAMIIKMLLTHLRQIFARPFNSSIFIPTIAMNLPNHPLFFSHKCRMSEHTTNTDKWILLHAGEVDVNIHKASENTLSTSESRKQKLLTERNAWAVTCHMPRRHDAAYPSQDTPIISVLATIITHHTIGLKVLTLPQPNRDLTVLTLYINT